MIVQVIQYIGDPGISLKSIPYLSSPGPYFSFCKNSSKNNIKIKGTT